MSLRYGHTPSYVPGTQAISITSPHIAYARYTVPVPVAEGSDGHAKRGQVLERAWRDLNARSTNAPNVPDEPDEPDTTDTTGIAETKERETYAVLRVEEGTPVLWAFAMDNHEMPGMDGLEVSEKGSLDCRKLVLCSTHGNDLDCLSTSKNRGCDVKWTPGEMARYWDRLAMAMLEGMAWRDGKRVYAERYESHLWPMSNDRLALVVQDLRDDRRSKSGSAAECTLEPIGIRAIALGDYDPTPAQRLDLIAGLTASLGASALDPRMMDLDTELESGQAQWGVYWVSTSMDRLPGDDIRRHAGRLAMWPKALYSGTTAPQGRFDGPNHDSPPPLPLPASEDSSPDSLMQVATGLFDFFNTYVPPSEVDIADITPETEGPDQLGSSPYEGSAPFAPSPTSPKSRRASDAASDLDDLFSAGSPSPPTATKPLEPAVATITKDVAETATVDATGNAGFGDVNDSAAQTGPDEPDMSMDIDENMYAQMKEWEDLTGLDGAGGAGGAQTGGDDAEPGVSITEDDFNFFDSPAPPDAAPPAEEQGRSEAPVDVDATAEGAALDVVDLTTDVDGHPQQHAGSLPNPTASGALPHSPEGTAAAPIDIDEEVIAEAPRDLSAERSLQTGHAPNADSVAVERQSASPDAGLPARRKTVTFEIERSSPPPEFEDAEVVPVGYEPLEIDPALTSFKYGLPSPAASPETHPPHRLELVKRMQAAADTQAQKGSYASEWDIESEQSDDEDSEDFSGAPPTPVSMIDTEPLDSLATTPRKEVGSKDGAEGLRWEGLDVLGPDAIAEMRWEGSDASAVGWKDAWNRFAGTTEGVDHGEVRSGRILEGVDAGTLFDALLTNRHLRDLLQDITPESDLSGVARLGMLSGDTPKPLAPCNIHVGLRNAVCQIAMSALLYSRQLGLQPLGGEKDVSALVLAEVNDWRAKGFLSDMTRVYETYNFGWHRTAKHSLAKDGVITLPPAGFADTLSALMPNLPSHSVVYVLLPIVDPTALAKLISRLLSVSTAPENVVLKLVPAHAHDGDSLFEIAQEVYDEITRPLDPISVRGSHIDLPVASLQYPAFTLAPLGELKVDLSLSWPLRSYDVLNRWRLVHCAYGWNEARNRLVGFVVDGAGEGWSQFERAVEEDKVDEVLHQLGAFFAEFGKRASVEYRLCICAVGTISKGEIDYWTKTGPSSKIPLTLVVAGSQTTDTTSAIRTPATVVPISGAIFADSTTRLIDESLAGTAAELPRLPVRLAASSDHVIPASSVSISIGQPESASTSVYHVLSHRCPPDHTDNANELVSNEFYRLACLARARFGIGREGGVEDDPVHVAYVRMCLEALSLLRG